MPSNIFVNVAGNWHAAGQGSKGIFVKVSGSWRQVSNGYVHVGGVWRRDYFSDNAGPGLPTGYFSDFVNGGQCRLTWTNPGDADFSYMHTECYLPGYSAPVWVQDVHGSAGGTYSVINTANNPYYQIQSWFLTPYDSNGNAGATIGLNSMDHTGAARGRTPSPITFMNTSKQVVQLGYQTASVTVVSGTVGGATNFTPVSGGSPDGFPYATMLYYGNQFFDQLRGANINGASIGMYVWGTNGSSDPKQLVFAPTNLQSGQPSYTFDVTNRYRATSNVLGGTFATSPSFIIGAMSHQYDFCQFNPGQLPYFGHYDGNRTCSVLIFDGQDGGFGDPNAGTYPNSFMSFYDSTSRSDWTGWPVVPGQITIAHDG